MGGQLEAMLHITLGPGEHQQLNLVVLCTGIPEAVQSSKDSSPVVTGQIILDLVKI